MPKNRSKKPSSSNGCANLAIFHNIMGNNYGNQWQYVLETLVKNSAKRLTAFKNNINHIFFCETIFPFEKLL